MADEGEKNSVSETVDSAIQKSRHLPAAQEADTCTEPPTSSPSARLFGRKRSVHELLGGGRVADIILWRKPKLSAAILGIATVVYVVFEWLGCHVLSVVSIGLLIVLGALFLWSNVAALVKRSPLDVPMPQISEEQALHVALVLRDEVNLVMNMLREIVLGKDIKLFLKVELVLWILSFIGKWADFMSLVYLGIFLVLTVPVLYERHEEKVDRALQRGFEQARRLHGKVHDLVVSRVPQLASRKKKVT